MWFIKSCRMQNVIENSRKGTRSMTTRKVLFHEKLLMMGCVAAIACAEVQAATFERTIQAPDGIGDVVALTNALTELNEATDVYDYKTQVKIWLKPGTYDLSGVYMTSSHHLTIRAFQGGILAGLGADRGDTILLGGGEDGGHGVLLSGGGGNFGYFTISNLTVTGGWAAGNGGGINGTHSTAYRYLIVSNNYAKGSSNGSGGGGCFKGCAYDCLFADNHCTEHWGGGFIVDGYSTRNETKGQGAWNCVFIGNTAKDCGGGFALNGGGQCEGCAFTNNTAATGSGVYFYNVDYTTYNGTKRVSCASNCIFSGNAGNGALYVNYSIAKKNVPVTDCEFVFNIGAHTVYCGDLAGCAIESNTNGTGVVGNSSLDRCVLKGNAVKNRYCTGVDYRESGFPEMTNVNCRIESNCFLEEYGKILNGKSYVNCTILGNTMPNGGNYGYLSRDCVFHNCVLSGNKISSSKSCDVRTVGFGDAVVAVTMTNCVFSATDIASGEIGADGTVSHEGLSGCCKIAAGNLKFENAANGLYTPLRKSPLCDTGLRDAWILSAVGGVDLADNPRVMGDGIDIGAYECQWAPVGMVISVR